MKLIYYIMGQPKDSRRFCSMHAFATDHVPEIGAGRAGETDTHDDMSERRIDKKARVFICWQIYFGFSTGAYSVIVRLFI